MMRRCKSRQGMGFNSVQHPSEGVVRCESAVKVVAMRAGARPGQAMRVMVRATM